MLPSKSNINKKIGKVCMNCKFYTMRDNYCSLHKNMHSPDFNCKQHKIRTDRIVIPSLGSDYSMIVCTGFLINGGSKMKREDQVKSDNFSSAYRTKKEALDFIFSRVNR